MKLLQRSLHQWKMDSLRAWQQSTQSRQPHWVLQRLKIWNTKRRRMSITSSASFRSLLRSSAVSLTVEMTWGKNKARKLFWKTDFIKFFLIAMPSDPWLPFGWSTRKDPSYKNQNRRFFSFFMEASAWSLVCGCSGNELLKQSEQILPKKLLPQRKFWYQNNYFINSNEIFKSSVDLSLRTEPLRQSWWRASLESQFLQHIAKLAALCSLAGPTVAQHPPTRQLNQSTGLFSAASSMLGSSHFLLLVACLHFACGYSRTSTKFLNLSLTIY